MLTHCGLDDLAKLQLVDMGACTCGLSADTWHSLAAALPLDLLARQRHRRQRDHAAAPAQAAGAAGEEASGLAAAQAAGVTVAAPLRCLLGAESTAYSPRSAAVRRVLPALARLAPFATRGLRLHLTGGPCLVSVRWRPSTVALPRPWWCTQQLFQRSTRWIGWQQVCLTRWARG